MTQALVLRRSIRLLHFALVAGLALVGGTFALLLRIQGRPLEGPSIVSLVLAGAAVSLLIVAAAVVRPKVPERSSDQSPEAYWDSAEARGAAILLWAVVDGAGLVSCVGFLLTGGAAPAAAAVLSILALLLFRPSRLEA